MAEQTITRDHLTIEHGTARWGGPTATITVNNGTLAGRQFWLRSTQGLDGDNTDDLARGGGIHLDTTDPDQSHRGWRGAFKTFDMQEAIGGLLVFLNEEAFRLRVVDSAEQEAMVLRDAVDAFTEALDGGNGRNWPSEWRRVQELVASIDMRIREATR